MMKLKWKYLVLLFLAVDLATSHDQETCFAADPQVVSTEPAADVVIGAVLDLHEPGEGVYGCGQPSADGVHYYEALRLAVSVLNQDQGVVSGLEVNESFVPGVKFGLQVYDSCGHKDLSMRHLTELFPIMKSGALSCFEGEDNASSIIGAVDTSRILSDSRVAETAGRFVIPVVPLLQENAVPPEQMAKVLGEVVHDMDWEKVAILHAEDEYSIFVAKVFSQVAKSGYPCITAIKPLPAGEGRKGASPKAFAKMLSSFTSKLTDRTGVIVIGQGKAVEMILRAFNDSPSTFSRLQWLFSWLPPFSTLQALGNALNKTPFYSLAPYPQQVADFEEYWRRLGDTSSVGNSSDRFFVEYVMARKNCRVRGYDGRGQFDNLVPCDNLVVREEATDVLLRTARFLPSLHAVFTFAHAYRKAWIDQCRGQPGVCKGLKDMPRRQFVEQYLESVEFEHDQESRSPAGVQGQKTSQGVSGEMEGMQLALTMYLFSQSNGLQFKQVLAYDALEAKVVDPAFHYTPSVCPKGGCKDCISVRQSRVEDPYVGMSSTPEDVLVAPQADEISVPVLLPIHGAGRNPLECGEEVNPQAVQDLEAALWTVDQINRDTEFLPDVRLKVVGIDTCRSPVQVTQKLSSYLLDTGRKEPDDVRSGLAFVVVGRPEVVNAASAIVSPLNATTVSVSDAIRPKDMDALHLQVAPPLEKKTRATVDTLVSLGWNYVTVVHDADARSRLMLDSFRAFAKEHDVCVAEDLSPADTSDLEMDRVLAKVIEAKRRGARAVVMWTSEATTEAFLRSVHRSVLVGAVARGDLVIVSSGDWIVNLQSFKEFENEVTGVIVLKTQQGEVEDFATYYQRLEPQENRRNPWFKELWEQNQCRDRTKCDTNVPPVAYRSSASTTNIIQGLLAISAGLARLRNELCHPQPGVCPKMLQTIDLRRHLFEYIRETASSRLDARGEMFAFTKQGYGNLPIEIFNFRRAAGKNFVYQKVGTYQTHLNSLAEIVMYNSEGREIPVDQLASECQRGCDSCGRRPTDFVILDSKDHLYLATSVDVHESTSNPLVCSPAVSPQGVQALEAFLWALDQINSSPQLLPGVNLGAVVFDTCSSQGKAARDVANFFSSASAEGVVRGLPQVDQIMGLVAAQADADVIRPIVDVATPFGMMTVAPRVTATRFGDRIRYPTLLRLSLPDEVRAGALVDLLRHFRWNYVSALCSGGSRRQVGLFEAFRRRAGERQVEMAMAEQVPPGFTDSAMSVLFNKLQAKRNEGSRVVVLFLDDDDSMKLFSTVKTELDGGRMDIGDFVWVAFETVDAFHRYPLASLGALMLRPSHASVFPFKQYFGGLSPRNNSRNPWFRDYWEQVYKCKGSNCDRTRRALADSATLQDSSVAKVIDSVLAVGVGLEALRQEVCPGLDRGLCPALREDTARIREVLFNLTLESTFRDAEGKTFRFTPNGYAANVLDVLNFRQVGNNAHAFVNVGQYSPDEGLSLNSSRLRTYNEFGKEISLYDVRSSCGNCKPDSASPFASAMQMSPRPDFAVAVLMPVHTKSKDFFRCGPIRDASVFHHLVSVAYAVQRVNRNATLVPGIDLGTIVFDYCDRPQKGEEMLYSYFSRDNEAASARLRVKPRSIFAALTFGSEMSRESRPIFESLELAHVGTQIDRLEPDGRGDVLYASPSMLSQVLPLVAILSNFGWRYVNVIYSNTDFGRAGYYEFAKRAKEAGVCLANVVLVEPDSGQEALLTRLQSGLSRDAQVVVSLVDDERVVERMVEAIRNSYVLSRYLWVGTETWGDSPAVADSLSTSTFDAIALKMEGGGDAPADLRRFYERLSPRDHFPIPDAWFAEFWQRRFQCQLPESGPGRRQRQYAADCTGEERLSGDDLTAGEHLYHTVRIVQAFAEGLHRYLSTGCPYGMVAASVDDCGNGSRRDLYAEIRAALHGEPYADCEECGSPGTVFGYEILQHSRAGNGTHLTRKIGSWKDNAIFINDSLVSFSHGQAPSSPCTPDCEACAGQSPGQVQSLVTAGQAFHANFQTVWGIVVTALSVLGIVLVIICALYFLMSFPITVGTTVLGYMILFGLLLLYSVNFAFVLSPSEGTCGIRRFGLGLAYAVIFAGMLVKVMNTWRLMGYNGSRILSDGTRLSSPAGLLVIAVGLVIIQVVLSSAWLILMPPATGAYERVWRCAPPSTFEESLIVSLVYVMLLLAITTLFALLTWQCQDNNRESRWILACALLVAVVWLAWTVLSTQLSPHYRDATIAGANLANASIIMACLYLRKVYLYSKLSRQARDQDMKARLHAHSIYGSSQKTFSTLAPVLYGSQASLTTKKLYNVPSSRVELINCPEDNKSDSSGSVQVQATDLYPLDMYDGGSQFQPVSSLYGSNHTLVLDDTLTFGR